MSNTAIQQIKPVTRVVSVHNAPPSGIEISPARDGVDPGQIWSTIRYNWRFVLLLGVLAFSAVMAVTLLSGMTFRSTGRLYLGELDVKPRQVGASAERIDLSGDAQGDVWSEVEIITSRALVSRAILSSGLNVTVKHRGAPDVRYWKWLASKRDTDLVDGANRELRVTNAQLSSRRRLPQTYLVRFQTDEDYQVWSESGKLGTGRLGEPAVIGDLDFTLLKGFDTGPKKDIDYELTVNPLEDVIESAVKSLDVSVPKATNTGEPVKVVTLTFKGNSPRLSAAFLEALMQAYLEERRSWKTEDATAAEAFVSEQLKGVRASLDDLQNKLANYRANNRAVVLDNEAKALIEQVGKYEEQRVAARLQVAALTDIKRALKDPNPPLGAYLLGEAEDTVLENMSKQLTAARERMTDLQSRYNSAAPELKEQEAQVKAQLDGIRNYVSSRLARAQENQATLGGLIGQFESKLKSVPGAEIGLARLSRESEVYGRLYSYLLERQQQMAIIKASTVSKNRILDAPQPVLREDSPKLALRLASGPLGLLLGVLVVVLHSVLSDTFQSQADLKRSLNGLPIFACVPRARAVFTKRRKHDPKAAPSSPDWKYEEAFRTLRNNLYHYRIGEKPKVIMITSARAGDGKTTCALALATLLAADDKKVLVVDADLRQPSHRFGYGAPQLEDALNGNCDWRDTVYLTPAALADFDSIGASRPATPELLSSTRMANLIEDARQHYDFILLDCPSFPPVADALALAPLADCVLSVIGLQTTSRRLVAEHLSRLSLSTRYQAVIVNDARPARPRILPRDPAPAPAVRVRKVVEVPSS